MSTSAGLHCGLGVEGWSGGRNPPGRIRNFPGYSLLSAASRRCHDPRNGARRRTGLSWQKDSGPCGFRESARRQDGVSRGAEGACPKQRRRREAGSAHAHATSRQRQLERSMPRSVPPHRTPAPGCPRLERGDSGTPGAASAQGDHPAELIRIFSPRLETFSRAASCATFTVSASRMARRISSSDREPAVRMPYRSIKA